MMNAVRSESSTSSARSIRRSVPMSTDEVASSRIRMRGLCRIARAMLMVEPPSIDGNELTDKGYINQRAGLERRAALVERLYADKPGEDVIVLN